MPVRKKSGLQHYGQLLDLADHTILYLFTLELVLRFFATERSRDFFRSAAGTCLDLVIVAVSFLPASEFFTVARLFRVLRVLRGVSVLPDLQRLVAALLRSLPSLGHITLLLVLLIYVYAAIGTSFFANLLPQYSARYTAAC
jgi:voltage-gated sodium channel